MSRLRIFEDVSAPAPRVDTTDGKQITRQLDSAGVRFERWQAATQFSPDADGEAVIAAYRKDVDRLMRDNGYKSVDVVRIQPNHPQKDEFRRKFLSEHTHSEDEVRFFVEGCGQFYLHMKNVVYAVLCERGDLISVPASTTHWFDMGPAPQFAAIRLFVNPDGWVARLTGNDIAERFPKFGE
jgi:1,2-dihydroxy-3-keto-5-methylthiopentene dioxygenase